MHRSNDHMTKNRTHISKFLFALFFLALIFLFSCNKENEKGEGVIPNVYVNFTIYPYTIDFIAPGTYKYYNDYGYRGVIIYRDVQDIFYAYERTCPYDPEKDCAQVEVTESGNIAVDSCCMSQYLLLDGSPFSGPSTLPLKQYYVQFNGDALTVINTP